MSHVDPGPLSAYNSLTDPHLAGFFSNTRMRRHLSKQGLVTRRGQIVTESTYRLNMARKEHKGHVKNLLAQAIVHKTLDLERHRQVEIKRKLEEIAKIELVRRVRSGKLARCYKGFVPWVCPPTPVSSSTSSEDDTARGESTTSESDNYTLPGIQLDLLTNPWNDRLRQKEDAILPYINQINSTKPPSRRRKSAGEKVKKGELRDGARSASPTIRRKNTATGHKEAEILPLLSPRSRARKSNRPTSVPMNRYRSRKRQKERPTSAPAQDNKGHGRRSHSNDDGAPESSRNDQAQEDFTNKNFSYAEIDTRNLTSLDTVALRKYAAMLSRHEQGVNAVSPYLMPQIGYRIPSPPKSPRRSARSRPARRMQSSPRESTSARSTSPTQQRTPREDSNKTSPQSTDGAVDGQLILHRQEPAMKGQENVQSFCTITLKYTGKNLSLPRDQVDPTQEVLVEQQHCGGNTLPVFKKRLVPGSTFRFISRRHRGYPFSLSLYIDGIMDCRVSSCCEYKHVPGSKLGGKQGHFSLTGVTGSAPCYRCQVEKELRLQRKNKKKSKAKETVASDEQKETTVAATEEENEEENNIVAVEDSDNENDTARKENTNEEVEVKDANSEKNDEYDEDFEDDPDSEDEKTDVNEADEKKDVEKDSKVKIIVEETEFIEDSALGEMEEETQQREKTEYEEDFEDENSEPVETKTREKLEERTEEKRKEIKEKKMNNFQTEEELLKEIDKELNEDDFKKYNDTIDAGPNRYKYLDSIDYLDTDLDSDRSELSGQKYLKSRKGFSGGQTGSPTAITKVKQNKKTVTFDEIPMVQESEYYPAELYTPETSDTECLQDSDTDTETKDSDDVSASTIDYQGESKESIDQKTDSASSVTENDVMDSGEAEVDNTQDVPISANDMSTINVSSPLKSDSSSVNTLSSETRDSKPKEPSVFDIVESNPDGKNDFQINSKEVITTEHNTEHFPVTDTDKDKTAEDGSDDSNGETKNNEPVDGILNSQSEREPSPVLVNPVSSINDLQVNASAHSLVDVGLQPVETDLSERRIIVDKPASDLEVKGDFAVDDSNKTEENSAQLQLSHESSNKEKLPDAVNVEEDTQINQILEIVSEVNKPDSVDNLVNTELGFEYGNMSETSGDRKSETEKQDTTLLEKQNIKVSSNVDSVIGRHNISEPVGDEKHNTNESVSSENQNISESVEDDKQNIQFVAREEEDNREQKGDYTENQSVSDDQALNNSNDLMPVSVDENVRTPGNADGNKMDQNSTNTTNTEDSNEVKFAEERNSEDKLPLQESLRIGLSPTLQDNDTTKEITPETVSHSQDSAMEISPKVSAGDAEPEEPPVSPHKVGSPANENIITDTPDSGQNAVENITVSDGLASDTNPNIDITKSLSAETVSSVDFLNSSEGKTKESELGSLDQKDSSDTVLSDDPVSKSPEGIEQIKSSSIGKKDTPLPDADATIKSTTSSEMSVTRSDAAIAQDLTQEMAGSFADVSHDSQDGTENQISQDILTDNTTYDQTDAEESFEADTKESPVAFEQSLTGSKNHSKIVNPAEDTLPSEDSLNSNVVVKTESASEIKDINVLNEDSNKHQELEEESSVISSTTEEASLSKENATVPTEIETVVVYRLEKLEPEPICKSHNEIAEIKTEVVYTLKKLEPEQICKSHNEIAVAVPEICVTNFDKEISGPDLGDNDSPVPCTFVEESTLNPELPEDGSMPTETPATTEIEIKPKVMVVNSDNDIAEPNSVKPNDPGLTNLIMAIPEIGLPSQEVDALPEAQSSFLKEKIRESEKLEKVTRTQSDTDLIEKEIGPSEDSQREIETSLAYPEAKPSDTDAPKREIQPGSDDKQIIDLKKTEIMVDEQESELAKSNEKNIKDHMTEAKQTGESLGDFKTELMVNEPESEVPKSNEENIKDDKTEAKKTGDLPSNGVPEAVVSGVDQTNNEISNPESSEQVSDNSQLQSSSTVSDNVKEIEVIVSPNKELGNQDVAQPQADHSTSDAAVLQTDFELTGKDLDENPTKMKPEVSVSYNAADLIEENNFELAEKDLDGNPTKMKPEVSVSNNADNFIEENNEERKRDKALKELTKEERQIEKRTEEDSADKLPEENLNKPEETQKNLDADRKIETAGPTEDNEAVSVSCATDLHDVYGFVSKESSVEDTSTKDNDTESEEKLDSKAETEPVDPVVKVPDVYGFSVPQPIISSESPSENVYQRVSRELVISVMEKSIKEAAIEIESRESVFKIPESSYAPCPKDFLNSSKDSGNSTSSVVENLLDSS